MRNLKSRLGQALLERGISQATLAAILDVPRSSISNWLRNQSIPTNQLIKLALELNISIDWLVMGEGPMKLFGPQYVNLSDKLFIESLRQLGDKVTESYLQFLHHTIEPAYGPAPHEFIGFTRFMEETRAIWAVVAYDGSITAASSGLFDLLKVDPKQPEQLIGSNVFIWIAEEFIGTTIMQFTRFLNNSDTGLEVQPFKCRMMTSSGDTTSLLTMYYAYDVNEHDSKSSHIHVVVI